jgi:hypothetical protein
MSLGGKGLRIMLLGKRFKVPVNFATPILPVFYTIGQFPKYSIQRLKHSANYYKHNLLLTLRSLESYPLSVFSQ